jgi:uncharacterized membrane protein
MESRAKFLGHPLHQMLIPLPAGLFIVAALLDIVGAFVVSSWIPTVTYWNIALGIVSALLAAVFGIADWTKIPKGTRARRVGALHGIGNVVAVVMFGIALWVRSGDPLHRTTPAALTLEILAFGLLGVTAWLGGELVDRLGIGVDDGAHADAPSSLRMKRVPSSTSASAREPHGMQ